MSLTLLRRVFDEIPNNTHWSLQLLRMTDSKRRGMQYSSAEISLDRLDDFISELSQSYVMPSGQLDKYASVSEYDGTAVFSVVYKLSPENALVHEELERLITTVASPEREADALSFTAQAYLLKGIVSINGEDMPVKLISMQNPITTLKHKFLCSNGSFKQIREKVLSLRLSIDIVIIDRSIYFLTFAGEKLFGMERAYREICSKKVEQIAACKIVSDIDAFKAVATSGHNPRRFLAFKETKLAAMQSLEKRIALADKFGLSISDGKFDTTVDGVSEKIVKLLCSKGMLDPIDDTAVEVTGAKKWQ